MFTKRLLTAMIATMMVVMMLINTIAVFAQDDEVAAPEAVVNAFYTDYLGHFYASETEPTFPPEGWYRESDLLTAEFVAMLDAFEDRYDPLLCAQNVPTAFLVDDAVFNAEADADGASVVVRTNFADFHAVEVELVQQDDNWLINHVACSTVEQDPEGVVKQFYLIFLSYNAWDGEGDPPNYFADEAYTGTPLLSDAFVAEVDALRTDGDMMANYDPFVCAQDRVQTVEIIASSIEDEVATVDVETNFEDHGFQVVLEHAEDAWIITNIVCTAN